MQVKVKLEEGHFYPFKLTGFLELPDGNEHYIVKDPNNVKHLLLKRYYRNYNFKLGETIQCRIDKINCNGKIYLEPKHPVYTLGGRYEFPYLYTDEYTDNRGNIHKFAIFTDVFENEIKMPSDVIPTNISTGAKLTFTVSRIKKGRVYLTGNGKKEIFKHFKPGIYYTFKIVQFRLYPDDRSFYILEDKEGKLYKLRSKFYEEYGFKIGLHVRCRLVNDEGESYLEPKHPEYFIGKIYKFKVVGEDLIDDYPTGKIEAYLLENKYGKDVHVPKQKVKRSAADNHVTCRVTAIKKSRLFLKC
jgi:hypothetical protein